VGKGESKLRGSKHMKTLTGKTRYRGCTQLFSPNLLVLQVEETHDGEHMAYDEHCDDVPFSNTYYRDATIEDLQELQKIESTNI